MWNDLAGRARRAARIVGGYGLLAARFVRLYWPYLAAAVGGAAVSWLLAEAASDYTKGGWELHLEQRAWGLDLHFHHWYYGLPLLLFAFTLLDTSPISSVFVFVFGMSLAAHSYHNEGGVPSIFEGGATLAVPAYLYWPVSSLLAALFTFFVVRSHEWLSLTAQREEVATSYVAGNAASALALDALDAWGREAFDRAERRSTRHGVHTASYSRLETRGLGIREVLCSSTPLDAERRLLTVRVQQMPVRGREGDLLATLARVDELLRPHAAPLDPSAPPAGGEDSPQRTQRAQSRKS